MSWKTFLVGSHCAYHKEKKRRHKKTEEAGACRLGHVVIGRVAGRAVNWKLDAGGLETLPGGAIIARVHGGANLPLRAVSAVNEFG